MKKSSVIFFITGVALGAAACVLARKVVNFKIELAEFPPEKGEDESYLKSTDFD